MTSYFREIPTGRLVFRGHRPEVTWTRADPIVRFVTYDETTGEILKTGSAPLSMVDLQSAEMPANARSMVDRSPPGSLTRRETHKINNPGDRRSRAIVARPEV